MSKKSRKQVTAADGRNAEAVVTSPSAEQGFKLGKPYNVRPNTQMDNAATWALITGAVQKNGGTATRAQLLEAVKPRNHPGMVAYAVRRGWLQPVAP